MRCIHKDTVVKDSRACSFLNKEAVRRRRKCLACGVTYSTLEVHLEDVKLLSSEQTIELLKGIISDTAKITELIESSLNNLRQIERHDESH
jgi:transcriptional regulator NrdR family protein